MTSKNSGIADRSMFPHEASKRCPDEATSPLPRKCFQGNSLENILTVPFRYYFPAPDSLALELFTRNVPRGLRIWILILIHSADHLRGPRIPFTGGVSSFVVYQEAKLFVLLPDTGRRHAHDKVSKAAEFPPYAPSVALQHKHTRHMSVPR